MKLKIMILVILLILPGIMAQTLPTTHRVASEISDQTIVLSFHSWGEGQTITLDLDNYLPSFRPSSKRIIFTAPPEVEIEVDQTTGKTTLRAQVDWIGTREIIFSLADIHEVPARKQQIINYESELIKQRIPDRVQSQLNEFQDMVMFNYLDKILEDLEKESSFIEVPPIDVIRDNSSFKIDVGETIDLRISILTENEEGIKTLKPQLGVNIISESEPTEAEIVEEDGTSILILIPLVFIILALLISLFVYFKNNRNKVRTVYHKLIPEKSKLETTKIQKDIDNLKSQLRETKSIESSLGKVPIEDSAIKFYTTIKEFFNTLTHPNYEFTFSELKKEIINEINNIELQKEKSLLLIVKNAQKLIKSNQKIFTHCHSTTVIEILKQANRSKKIRVRNTETRPLFQGRITAKELSQAKIPVEHYTDTAARIAIKDSDIMLIGADSITHNKVYNKIGSELFSIIAKHEKVPVYICASLMKFTNQREEIENRHPDEVWKDAPKNIHINNPAFEKIAFKYIKGIICEKGILKPKQFVKEAKKMLKGFSL